MVGICFAYDGGYKSLLRDQYFELAKAFPGLVIYEAGAPQSETSTYNGQSFTKVTNADDLPLEPELVVLTSQDSPNISGDVAMDVLYIHPANVIYFFGDNHSDLTQDDIGTRTDYTKLYIPINHNVWAPQAVAMVLLDRQCKL